MYIGLVTAAILNIASILHFISSYFVYITQPIQTRLAIDNVIIIFFELLFASCFFVALFHNNSSTDDDINFAISSTFLALSNNLFCLFDSGFHDNFFQNIIYSITI